MDNKLLVALAAAAAAGACAALAVVALIVWPSPWLFAVVVVLCVTMVVPGTWAGWQILRLFVKAVGRLRDTGRDISALAGTVGRAAPVLRRIDDRGRALMHDRPWEKAVADVAGAAPEPTLNAAVMISDKAEALAVIAAWHAQPGLCGRLVMVLDPARRGRWGTWVDDPLGEEVTVVAAEHLVSGAVDLDRLFSSRLVLCGRARPTGTQPTTSTTSAPMRQGDNADNAQDPAVVTDGAGEGTRPGGGGGAGGDRCDIPVVSEEFFRSVVPPSQVAEALGLSRQDGYER